LLRGPASPDKRFYSPSCLSGLIVDCEIGLGIAEVLYSLYMVSCVHLMVSEEPLKPCSSCEPLTPIIQASSTLIYTMGLSTNTNGLFIHILRAFLRNANAFRLLLPYEASRASNSLESTSTADYIYTRIS
jgi:hypothetical protein